jgi:hypothetical protein
MYSSRKERVRRHIKNLNSGNAIPDNISNINNNINNYYKNEPCQTIYTSVDKDDIFRYGSFYECLTTRPQLDRLLANRVIYHETA